MERTALTGTSAGREARVDELATGRNCCMGFPTNGGRDIAPGGPGELGGALAGDDRRQDPAPEPGTAVMAAPQRDPLRVAETVGHGRGWSQVQPRRPSQSEPSS